MLKAIQTITLGSTQSNITFNNIPQNFKHLVIMGNTRRDSASGTGSFSLQFNNDTNATGRYSDIQCSTSANTSTAIGGQMYGLTGTSSYNSLEIGNCGNSTDVANSFPCNTITIFNYSSSTLRKDAYSHGSQFNPNAYSYQTMYAGWWDSLAPITSIKMYPTSGASFVAGSSVTLYGLASGSTIAGITIS
jgi:hypothetical protein